MNAISFNECVDVIIKIGQKNQATDGTESFKLTNSNQEYQYIPLTKSIYLRDLFLEDELRKSPLINNTKIAFPFLILDENNFGSSDSHLYDSLINYVKSYQQMTDLDKELIKKESDEPIKKPKI